MVANEKAEKIFLALLLKEQNILNYIDLLRVDYFTTLLTQNIYNAIRKLFISNSPINEATIEQLSGSPCGFLFHSIKDDIETYYNIIHNNYVKRELVALAKELDSDKTADQLLSKTEEVLTKLTSNTTNDTSGDSLMYEAMKSTEKAFEIRNTFGLAGISLIHQDVDSIIQGLKPGTLNILAARPSTGKSLYAIHILVNNALIYKTPSLMVSLEMSKDKVGQRIISNLLDVKFSALDTGYLSKSDLEKIYKPTNCRDCGDKSFLTQVEHQKYKVISICKKCGSNNVDTSLSDLHKNNTLLINDTPGLNLFKLMSTIKSHKIRHPDLNLVVIDHMGEINESSSKESEENRLARISKSLRDLGKELDIAILLLCQLNRDMEKENREPRSSDLRGSGRIEEHADTIVMLYRDIMGKEQKNNIIKCLVTKNRNGTIGECYIPVDLEYQRISKNKAVLDAI
jgi:replicative DNA helicase